MYYLDKKAASVERAEQVDLNADLHGGWTTENGKKKLNEWCQQMKIRAPECTYKPQENGILKNNHVKEREHQLGFS